MRYSLLVTGSGGQGVLSAGSSIAASAAQMAYATYVPWYGSAQRGGVAKCSVVISDKPILSPIPGKHMAMIAMNEDACQKGLSELVDGALVIRNSNRGSGKIKSANIMLMDVPADDLAKEAGSSRMVNMVLTGALLGFVKMLPLEVVQNAMLSKIALKDPQAAEVGKAALKSGFEWGADQGHIKQISSSQAASDSRYSIEKTTVGEILDTPELKAIVEKIFPQVLNHPLLEAGRVFKFVDAIPYMKDMIGDEDLEKFSEELESIK